MIDFLRAGERSFVMKNGFLLARNLYLVTQADILLACFDGQEGGTKNTVEYAQRNGCRVCLIQPLKKECWKAI